ncbi:calcium uniporter protein 4, mitochondrial-like [Rhodamnia argentea]|uniref:Calcium uniporter protein 4, mitochondrial-like n=1 Tax=Rhodamnia argentea TaxID=178133 RepID=A0A8B8QGT2_9MYRT|nr:calcium uniporter protein 4, mitochondrial-like [Rhodamnia argentea]
MALRKALAKRLFDSPRSSSAAAALPSLQAILPPPPNGATASFHREYLTSPKAAEKGLFRRFLQRRAINQAAGARLPEFLSLPVGDKLREKLRSLNGLGGGDRLQLGGLSPPVAGDPLAGVTIGDARKLLRLSRAETIKAKLREIDARSISYDEFVRICDQACGGGEAEGAEFAKALDESGNVIVLGNVVFLRPEQVAKSVESLIYQSIARPNDPRRRELEQMERHKALIDDKARAQVKGELYCGLGFLVAQTLGLMRLTFWELTWDVMEPICFFLTNLHVTLAYGFFLRTSREPTFEGYFQRRFKTKQQKLMKIHNFDADRYRELCRAFYPEESRSSQERA